MSDKRWGLLHGPVGLAFSWLSFNVAVFYTILSESWPTYVLFIGAGLSVVFGLALVFGHREVRRASDRRDA